MAKATSKTVKRQIGWDDDSIKTGGYIERPDKYTPKKGRTDRIRLMTLPIIYFGASVGGEGNGFYGVSCAKYEDAYLAVVEGDEEALERCKKQCPLFERGYPVKQRFVALIWHISSEARAGGKATKVNQFYPYPFAGTVYEQIRDAAKSLPLNASGKKTDIRLVELQVTCTDDRYKKVTVIPIVEKRQHQTTWAEAVEAAKDLFTEDSGNPMRLPDGDKCQLIIDTILPESRQSLLASINRVEGKESGGSEAETDEFATPARRGKKPAKAEESLEEDAGELNDEGLEEPGDDDLGGGEEQVEEEEAPPPRKPVAAKGGKPVAGKPAAAKRPAPPAADEEDIDINLD